MMSESSGGVGVALAASHARAAGHEAFRDSISRPAQGQKHECFDTSAAEAFNQAVIKAHVPDSERVAQMQVAAGPARKSGSQSSRRTQTMAWGAWAFREGQGLDGGTVKASQNQL